MVAPIGCSRCTCCALWAAKVDGMESVHAVDRRNYADNARYWSDERDALKARVEELLITSERLEHPKETQ